MSAQAQVTAQEVEAILEMVRPAVEQAAKVSPRDFKAPRRLSQPQLDALGRRAEKVMTDVSGHLSVWLRSAHLARVTDVVEAHAGGLIEGFVEPMRVIAFDINGQLGLLAWDLGAMVAAIEMALGSSDTKSAVARPLSTVEERLLTDMTTRIVTLVAGALGVEAKSFRVVREKKELSLGDDPSAGDPQRTGVHVALQGPAGESTLRIYLPCIKPPESPRAAAATKTPRKNTLSAPMGEIDIEVRAQLGAVTVPLQDLLQLEIGDVIVLDTSVGGPVTVTAEGEFRAQADLGRRDGRLALRLRSVERNTRTKWDET